MKDYYAILGCKPDTPQEDIIKYARRAAMEVNEAYDVLKDPVARAEYDKTLIKPIPIQTRQPRFSPPPKPTLNFKELQAGFKSIAILIIGVVFVWDMVFSKKPTPAQQQIEKNYTIEPFFKKGLASDICQNAVKERLHYPNMIDFKNMEISTAIHPHDAKLLIYAVTGKAEWQSDESNLDTRGFACAVQENTTTTPSRWGINLIF